MIVAVYGTLRKNMTNHYLLGDSKLVATVKLPGRMYTLGSFPGVKLEEEGMFVAELYDVTDKILTRLDSLEGYYPDFPELSMYIRKEVDVESDKGKWSKVQLYEYNGHLDTRRTRYIPSGDFAKYVRGEEDGLYLDQAGEDLVDEDHPDFDPPDDDLDDLPVIVDEAPRWRPAPIAPRRF